MSNFPSVTINKFLGVNKNKNKLNAIPGQLSLNTNYLYEDNGGLTERGGSAKVSDPPTTGRCFGLGVYENNANSRYPITAQGTDYYYYSSAWVAFGLSMTPSLEVYFEQAGYGANRAMYAANGSNSIVEIKMSGSVPAASTVTSPDSSTYLILHKNRLFTTDGRDTLYFTEALAFTDWNLGTNSIVVAPGLDGYIKGFAVWGDALFIFKEEAVYVLPNAADASPTTTWLILKTDASQGTTSPRTVVRTRIGIMYLSSDKKVRVISPAVTFSSGEYTLGGSGSPVVSEYIEDDIDSRLTSDNLAKASGVSYKDKYILSFRSLTNAQGYHDIIYFADTKKFLKSKTSELNQPFYGEFTGLKFDYWAVSQLGTTQILYGIRGQTGELYTTLDDSLHADDGEAIESRANVAWFAPDDDAVYKSFRKAFFYGETEGWSMSLIFNAYKRGKLLPNDGDGEVKTFTASDSSEIYVDGATLIGAVIGSGSTIKSSEYNVRLKGNWFKAEISNLNANQFTRIFSVGFTYRPIRRN